MYLDRNGRISFPIYLSLIHIYLTNMKIMMKSCNERSLILIDEFGGGTEPQIGGAIAEAVLKRFNPVSYTHLDVYKRQSKRCQYPKG